MPYIEPVSLDVGHGVGGGFASRNNVNFSRGPVGGWRDRDTAAFANGNDEWMVSVWNKVTGQIVRVEFPVDDGVVHMAAPPLVERAFSRSLARVLTQVEVPANTIYAGGGVVAAWLGSADVEVRGLYCTTGFRSSDAGLMGVGPDGTLAYKPLYQSNGPTVARELDGTEWQITPGHASALMLFGERRAIWMEGFVVRVANLPSCAYRNEDGIWSAQAAYVGGEWWTCYYSGKRGIILHPFASSEKCYPILPKGDGWHKVSVVSGNVLRIAISRTEGEGAGDIWGYDLNVANGDATPLPFGNQPQTPTHFDFVPTDSVNAPPPEPIIYPSYSFSHPVQVAVFKDPDNTSGAPWEILVNQNDQDKTARPLFVADDTLGSTWRGPLLGIYTEARDLTAVLAKAKSYGTRLLWCHDSDAPFALPAGLRPYDVPMAELYWFKAKGETFDAAVARISGFVSTLLQKWPGDCGLVPQFYCMGGIPGGNPPEVLTVAEVLRLLGHLNEWTNRSSRIKILAPFSYLRGNGITAHPELMKTYRDLLKAAPPGATLMPIPIDPPQPTTPYPAARPYQLRTT